MIKQKSCWVLEAESRVLFLGCLVWHGQAFSLLWTFVSPPEKRGVLDQKTPEELSSLTPKAHLNCVPACSSSSDNLDAPLVSLFACPSCDGRFHNLHPSWAPWSQGWHLKSGIENQTFEQKGCEQKGFSPAQNGPPSCQRGRDCGGQRNPFGLLWTSDPKTHTSFLPWKWWTSFKILFD